MTTEGMQEWERLLGIRWPDNACDQSGECCRGAAQSLPWERLLPQAAAGDETARAFLAQFVPYVDLDKARQQAPDAVAASLAIAAERGETADTVIFYRCRYLAGQNQCQVYEDRPTLCRDFPESPFGAIPACCGYAKISRQCRESAVALKQRLQSELAYYKNMRDQVRALQNPGSPECPPLQKEDG